MPYISFFDDPVRLLMLPRKEKNQGNGGLINPEITRKDKEINKLDMFPLTNRSF